MAVVPHPVGDQVHLRGDVSYAVILFCALSYFVQAFGEATLGRPAGLEVGLNAVALGKSLQLETGTRSHEGRTSRWLSRRWLRKISRKLHVARAALAAAPRASRAAIARCDLSKPALSVRICRARRRARTISVLRPNWSQGRTPPTLRHRQGRSSGQAREPRPRCRASPNPRR